MINMKYCIKCGNKLNDNDKFCNKCGYKIKKKISIKTKKTIIVSIITIVLILIIIPINIVLIKNFTAHRLYEKEIKNYIYDKDSKVTYKDSYHCKECLNNCDGSCFGTTDIENCMIYEFKVKENDFKYRAYYIINNDEIEYVSDRKEKLDNKIIKDKFKNKYKDYKIEINYTPNKFDKRRLNIDSGTTKVDITKYGTVSSVLTKELYNDIHSIIENTGYIRLHTDENIYLSFYKKAITLNYNYKNKYETDNIHYKYEKYYEVKLENKTYEEVIKEIMNNYDRY